MVISISRQDEPNPVIGYLTGHDGTILPARDYPPIRKIFAQSHRVIIQYEPSFFGQVGWILTSFFFFCEFIDLDSVSVYKHSKKNLANIQPFKHHFWSITHIYIYRVFLKSLSSLLCVSRKAEYKSRVSSGSGRSRKYSLNNAATSCGLSSSVNFVFSPESNSSLIWYKKEYFWFV